MKRKQFLAVLLSAILVAGSVPVSADTTPEATQSPAATESAQQDKQETTEEQDEKAEEQVKTDADTSQKEAGASAPDTTQAPAGEAPNKTDEGQDAPSGSTVFVGETGYESLAAAIAGAADQSEIKLTGSQVLKETVSIPAGKTFSVTTGDKSVKITRSAGFTGSFFSVSGTLNLGTDAMTQALVLDGTLSGTSSTAALVNVAAGGTAAIFGKTFLTNNKSTGTGGAVANAGTLTVKGSSITGNSAAKGGAIANSGTLNLTGAVISRNTATEVGAGIDNSGTLNVSGLVNVTENTIGTAANNIYLETPTPVAVISPLSKDSKLGITAKDAKEGLTVAKAAAGVALAEQTPYFTYDSGDYKVSDTGVLADAKAPALTKAKEAKRTGSKTASVYFTSSEAGTYYYQHVKSGAAAPTIDTSGSGEAMKAGENTLQIADLTGDDAQDLYIIGKDAAGNISDTLKIAVAEYAEAKAPVISKDKDSTRSSEKAAKVYFTSDSKGSYYYKVVEAAAAVPDIDTSGNGKACSIGSNTITLDNLAAGAKDIYIVVKNSEGKESSKLKIAIPDYKAPVEVKKADASKNQIYGLGDSYTTTQTVSFSGIGDRMDETSANANKGDERYIPFGFAIFNSSGENLFSKDKSEQNRGTKQEWTSNAAALRVNKAGTYTLKMYFNKEVFDGSEWVDAGEQVSRQQDFKVTGKSTSTTPITNGSRTSTIRSGSSNKSSGKSSGSSKSGSVKTADESPIVTMTLLLLASGSIAAFAGFRRKRIKKTK